MSRDYPAPDTGKCRNIVIMCDGTGNEIEKNLSNVTKLYKCIARDETQIVFYDPGIGTIGRKSVFASGWQNAKALFALATGWGLQSNVCEAYGFLVDHYRPGDRVYLFGFSRGAYTVRVLAGLLRTIGLLSPHQRNLIGFT